MPRLFRDCQTLRIKGGGKIEGNVTTESIQIYNENTKFVKKGEKRYNESLMDAREWFNTGIFLTGFAWSKGLAKIDAIFKIFLTVIQ